MWLARVKQAVADGQRLKVVFFPGEVGLGKARVRIESDRIDGTRGTPATPVDRFRFGVGGVEMHREQVLGGCCFSWGEGGPGRKLA